MYLDSVYVHTGRMHIYCVVKIEPNWTMMES